MNLLAASDWFVVADLIMIAIVMPRFNWRDGTNEIVVGAIARELD